MQRGNCIARRHAAWQRHTGLRALLFSPQHGAPRAMACEVRGERLCRHRPVSELFLHENALDRVTEARG
jgi:hypothetical protein